MSVDLRSKQSFQKFSFRLACQEKVLLWFLHGRCCCQMRVPASTIAHLPVCGMFCCATDIPSHCTRTISNTVLTVPRAHESVRVALNEQFNSHLETGLYRLVLQCKMAAMLAFHASMALTNNVTAFLQPRMDTPSDAGKEHVSP